MDCGSDLSLLLPAVQRLGVPPPSSPAAPSPPGKSGASAAATSRTSASASSPTSVPFIACITHKQVAAAGSSARHKAVLTQLIDTLGQASAAAQGLPHAITTAAKLSSAPEQTLYVACDGRLAVGFIKVGPRTLFIAHDGKLHEIQPLCVLDFFVAPSHRRRGMGLALFMAMCRFHGITDAACLAYDRPSPMFTGFLAKHFGLRAFTPQANNFVVFTKFFTDGNQKRSFVSNFTPNLAAPPIAMPPTASRARSALDAEPRDAAHDDALTAAADREPARTSGTPLIVPAAASHATGRMSASLTLSTAPGAYEPASARGSARGGGASGSAPALAAGAGGGAYVAAPATPSRSGGGGGGGGAAGAPLSARAAAASSAAAALSWDAPPPPLTPAAAAAMAAGGRDMPLIFGGGRVDAADMWSTSSRTALRTTGGGVTSGGGAQPRVATPSAPVCMAAPFANDLNSPPAAAGMSTRRAASGTYDAVSATPHRPAASGSSASWWWGGGGGGGGGSGSADAPAPASSLGVPATASLVRITRGSEASAQASGRYDSSGWHKTYTPNPR